MVPLLATLVLGCGTGKHSGAQPGGADIDLLTYDEAVYSADVDEAFTKCTRSGGASRGDTAAPMPPINTLVFDGNAEDRVEVVECLAALPGASVAAPQRR